jgi:hypothetical protein
VQEVLSERGGGGWRRVCADAFVQAFMHTVVVFNHIIGCIPRILVDCNNNCTQPFKCKWIRVPVLARLRPCSGVPGIAVTMDHVTAVIRTYAQLLQQKEVKPLSFLSKVRCSRRCAAQVLKLSRP